MKYNCKRQKTKKPVQTHQNNHIQRCCIRSRNGCSDSHITLVLIGLADPGCGHLKVVLKSAWVSWKLKGYGGRKTIKLSQFLDYKTLVHVRQTPKTCLKN